MSKRKFNKKDLINLVIKKANGYHYTEEVLEYEKTQNKSSLNKNIPHINENYNFFDICDRSLTKPITKDDKIELSNEKSQQQINENLTLVKKKVTTHYIPPDMLAIKILFEIYGKEIEYDNLNTLTDEELLDLKNKLIKEISNENWKNTISNNLWHSRLQ